VPAAGPGQNVTIDERHADGDYGSLVQRARRLQSDNGADLKVVITAGLVAGQAAVNVWPPQATPANNFPLLIASGRDNSPSFSSRTNTGGFIFEPASGTSLNGQRLSILSSNYQIPSSRTCLLYNKNSPMSTREVGDWTAVGGTLLYNAASATGAPGDPPIANSAINLANSIAGAAASTNPTASAPGAIIISADPFFTQNRKAIVLAGGATSNVVMCYPVFDYLIPKGNKRRMMIFGPLLEEVFFNLGAQAAAILTSVTTPAPLPTMSMSSMTPYYFGQRPAVLTTSALFVQFWRSLLK
jgi:hypothetical protein